MTSKINLITNKKKEMLKAAKKLIENDVMIIDPERVDIRGHLKCGKNVVIDINVIFEGEVELGDNVSIGANCILVDSFIGNGAHIKPFSLVEGAMIGENSFVGPYGRIRHGSKIENDVQIGNFVEIKNSSIKNNSKINHLSFIGDADIDEDVTIGAGTITCNHDGLNTNFTKINKGAYVGSGCNLVAPIRIGNYATIGAGSTITKDAPDNSLTIARSKQNIIESWKKRIISPKMSKK
jgi:bifunctional UDP-N-acetylglucosamine pyrophosphorylase/glucosamine-1-phosphate N-acetyltransferase